MDPKLLSFTILLSILWFLMYWILGGVFFAVITIARLGRLRKVRFSCLFSLLALGLGVGAAFIGVGHSQNVVEECMGFASSGAQMVIAVFGCGFASILSTFLLGAALLVIGGFLIMALSRSKAKPWIILDSDEFSADSGIEESSDDSSPKSKFF